MATVDVEIHGAGIFGLAIGWECVRRGARVRVVDPSGPGAGASGGVLGALAPHAPEGWNALKAFQLQGLAAQEDFWAGVVEAGGVDPGFARIGRLQPLRDAAAVGRARARADAARDLWGDAGRWEVVEGACIPGWQVAPGAGAWVHDTLSGRVRPAAACAALAAAITARGGEIAAQPGRAGAVVLATGAAGLAALSAELGRSVGRGQKGQAAVLGCDMGSAPQIYIDGLHVVPHADGTVAVGSTSEGTWQADGPDAQLDALIARVRALVPALKDAPVLPRWAGIRPRTASRMPLLGPHPTRAGVFLANGGFKIGIGLAPIVGRVMADLVLEGINRIPAEFGFDALPG